MKNIQKTLAFLLAVVMLLSLSACFGKEENVPENTSEGSNLYTGTDAEGNLVVVNRYNTVASNFSVDADGNILNAAGDLFIAKDNTLPYVPVSSVSAVSANPFPVDLPVGGTGAAQPVSVDIQVSISPINATCREIMVESDNTDVAEVPIAGYNIVPGSDNVTVKVTLKDAGTANIRVKSSAAEGADLAATITVEATVEGSSQPAGTGTPDGSDPTTEPSTEPGAEPTPIPTPSPTPAAGTGRTGYVTGDGVNFRSGPSTGSDVITTLGYGTQITVYSIENGWANVSVNGQTGYISATYVSYERPAVQTPKPTDDPYTSTGGGNDSNSDDPYGGNEDSGNGGSGDSGIIIIG